MTVPSDDRSPVAKAYHWSARIMVVSLEMVLPAVVGHWIDQRLGTVVLFMVVGLAVGCTGGVWHLIRMTSADTAHGQDRDQPSGGNNSGE